jgi:hypothetical protein
LQIFRVDWHAGQYQQGARTMIQDTERLSVFEAIGLLEQSGILPPLSKKLDGPLRIEPLQWLREEVEAGGLVFHDHTGQRIKQGEYPGHFGFYGETTSRARLNEWLEHIDHLRRIPEADSVPTADAPEAASAPAVAAVAPTPAPSASAPAVAAPEPAQKQRKPRRSWWDDVIGYLADVLRAGKHRTAKALHKAAEKLAGADGSPFEMVDRELRAREFGRVVAVKTLQNRWAEVKAAAGMR